MTNSAKPRAVAVSFIAHLPTAAGGPSPAEPSFLLVASRKHKNKWVLPKGGIEQGESAREAAQREAWEEAGLPVGSSKHIAHVQLVRSAKTHKESPTQDSSSSEWIAHSTYSFELFAVESQDVLAEHWPEEDEREREWIVGWAALKAAISWGDRAELMVAAAEVARDKLGALQV